MKNLLKTHFYLKMNVKVLLNYLTIKLLIKLICSLCLIYQIFMLSHQYLKFQSIINIRFTTNIIDNLPAITICYNKIISFEKFVKHYPEHIETYRNFTNFVRKFYGYWNNRSYDEFISKSNALYNYKYDRILIEQSELYYFTVTTKKENYLDIFDKYLISFHYDDEPFIRKFIDVTIYGDKGRSQMGNGLYQGYFLTYLNTIPIESIDLKVGTKCFTYFYEKEVTYFDKSINIVGLTITWNFNYTWFPFDEANRISFAIHSRNVKPAQNIFHNFEQTTTNMVMFSKVEEKRLTNYDNCRDYNKSHNDYESRIDCFEDCIFKINHRNCHDHIRTNSPYFLFRHQLSNLTQDENYECRMEKTLFELFNYCNKRCKEDCYQAYYLTSIKKLREYNLIRTYNKGGQIEIQPGSNPNILIEHFAEITFISLISNFGGLIGMYLGISLQSVCCNVWENTKKIFLKFVLEIKTKKNIRQNIQQNNFIQVNFSNGSNYFHGLRRPR